MASLFSSLSDAVLQARLDAIQEAILTGALTVTFQGQTVQYRSMNDLLRTSDLLLAEINARNNISGKRGKVRIMTSTKGFKNANTDNTSR